MKIIEKFSKEIIFKKSLFIYFNYYYFFLILAIGTIGEIKERSDSTGRVSSSADQGARRSHCQAQDLPGQHEKTLERISHPHYFDKMLTTSIMEPFKP